LVPGRIGAGVVLAAVAALVADGRLLQVVAVDDVVDQSVTFDLLPLLSNLLVFVIYPPAKFQPCLTFKVKVLHSGGLVPYINYLHRLKMIDRDKLECCIHGKHFKASLTFTSKVLHSSELMPNCNSCIDSI